MAPWEDFDSVFAFNKNFTYDGKVIEQILSNRRALDNQLFADRLLGLLGVKAVTKVYPPRSNADLRTLFEHIVSSPLDIHHKQALIYYLLKDCRAPNDPASQFSRRFHLPEKYRLFIEGLWTLDRLESRRAIEYLAEPSIIPTFPDEILYVLTLPHLPKHEYSLVMAYYHTVSPPLASAKVQKAFFKTLCRSSVTEAFYFTRDHDDSLRQNYLEQLIDYVHTMEAGDARSKRAMELIGLPFDDQEEGWFEESLLRGNAKGLHGAKDTVMMRRLATGKLDNLSADLESLEMVVCTFFQQGRCKFGERCKFEHPGQSTLGSGNRFGVLSGGGFGGRSGEQNQQPANYGITAADIKADLSAGKGRPEWVFSCYGPGRNAPKQLFGGPQREQSFEELRLRHYEAAAAGNADQALQEAQALYAEALKQMDVILSDLDGAVKYVVDGINEHPNRIDITEGKTGPASGQGPSAFGQSSASGQPAASSQSSAFGQPSSLGAQSAFGKPSGFAQPSTFGQPSGLGQSSGFGQPSALGPGSAFGQPSGLGGQPGFGKPAFGQPSLGQPAFGQPTGFGQPSSAGSSSFGTSTGASPFGAISSQNQGTGVGFGQAASTVSPFAQAASQQPAASTGFGQPSTTPATTGPFGQPTQTPSPFGQPQQLSNSFGQPAAAQNPFGQPAAAPSPFGATSQTQPQPQQPQTAPSPFGQPATGFSQPAQPQNPAPTATAGTGPPAIIKVANSNELSPLPPLAGQTVRDPMTKRLSSWKGQPVKYIENSPCYLHPQDRQTYVRIFFPDGPPEEASLRDATGKPEEYTPEVIEQYEFFVKNGYFKDGVIPSVPPKTEWVSFDF
ncbi:hypothetical protein BDV23DRAFT_172545 [Aspergillus alliaceus]|uniref:C3H1-type domain-containing protein n=1 Tax=Petromyces alliaceus TaxID=209559 RepID=A0A5N7C7U0_PETAA|nr:hypothetical protein BDV23DRAFT_172545 [Aspergillus alliaceus]